MNFLALNNHLEGFVAYTRTMEMRLTRAMERLESQLDDYEEEYEVALFRAGYRDPIGRNLSRKRRRLGF